MRRVVVTGLGVVSPVGIGVKENWENLTRGKSGISQITSVDLSKQTVTIGGEVKGFDATQWIEAREAKRMERYCHLAIAASKMAMNDAGFTITEENAPRVGTSIGVGVGGCHFFEGQIIKQYEKGSRFVSPFTIPGFIANMASGHVSIALGAKGSNLCNSTACAAGTHGIGEAFLHIATGMADAMLAGGSEAAHSQISFAGFARMKALTSAYNDNPEAASRPFDKDRSGFVMGEGAGVLFLEEYESAKKRGANILAELVGYGASSDAFHMTSPAEGGAGAVQAMRQALQTGKLNPKDIGYINAHGTSTPANDGCETQAIKTVFGDHAHDLNISSTKSMTGHLLGAAGGIEAVYSVLSLKNGIIPPTINYTTPDPVCDLNYTPNESVEKRFSAVISNSFGFGGTNAVLAFKNI